MAIAANVSRASAKRARFAFTFSPLVLVRFEPGSWAVFRIEDP